MKMRLFAITIAIAFSVINLSSANYYGGGEASQYSGAEPNYNNLPIGNGYLAPGYAPYSPPLPPPPAPADYKSNGYGYGLAPSYDQPSAKVAPYDVYPSVTPQYYAWKPAYNAQPAPQPASYNPGYSAPYSAPAQQTPYVYTAVPVFYPSQYDSGPQRIQIGGKSYVLDTSSDSSTGASAGASAGMANNPNNANQGYGNQNRYGYGQQQTTTTTTAAPTTTTAASATTTAASATTTPAGATTTPASGTTTAAPTTTIPSTTLPSNSPTTTPTNGGGAPAGGTSTGGASTGGSKLLSYFGYGNNAGYSGYDNSYGSYQPANRQYSSSYDSYDRRPYNSAPRNSNNARNDFDFEIDANGELVIKNRYQQQNSYNSYGSYSTPTTTPATTTPTTTTPATTTAPPTTTTAPSTTTAQAGAKTLGSRSNRLRFRITPDNLLDVITL